MKIEEHQKIVNDILKCDDKAKLSSLLRTLSADYVQMTNDLDTTKKNFVKVDEERKAFALENSRLWLERNTNTDAEETETIKDDNNNDEPKKMTFEDLYNSAKGDE